MTIDPLARRGFATAAAYEQGRSGYAPEAVRRVLAEPGWTRKVSRP